MVDVTFLHWAVGKALAFDVPLGAHLGGFEGWSAAGFASSCEDAVVLVRLQFEGIKDVGVVNFC